MRHSILGLAVTSAMLVNGVSASANPLFQNSLLWLGNPNPAPPATAVVPTTTPLMQLPEWMGGIGPMGAFTIGVLGFGIAQAFSGASGTTSGTN